MPHSISGMIQGPANVQGKFRDGIEFLDVRG